MRIAVYSGSFDPVTNGHLWVIESCKKLFDETHVVMGLNPNKKPMFSVEERLDLLRACTDCPCSYTEKVMGYCLDLAKEHTVIRVRGVRSIGDAIGEFKLNEWSEQYLGTKVYQMMLHCSSELQMVSSSVVKAAAEHGYWHEVRKMVPLPVEEKLMRCFIAS